jgi:hypothetical protein
MKPDTEQSLFYSAINALRIAGQGRLADDLDERMEKLCAKTPKVAVFVVDRVVQEIRSNIRTLDVEIVDTYKDPLTAADRWDEIETELESIVLDRLTLL